MIYKDKMRAMEVAAELDAWSHGMKHYACLVAEGWTVIGGFRAPKIGQYGVIELA